MAEHIIICDANAHTRSMAHELLLRAGWRHLHVAPDTETAIKLLNDCDDAAVLIANVSSLPDISPVLAHIDSLPTPVAVIAVEAASVATLPHNMRVVNSAFDAAACEIVVQEVARLRAAKAGRHLISILIFRPADLTPRGVVDSGTGCLLALPSRQVILTAAHVARAIKKPGVIGLAGGAGGTSPCDISNWPIIGIDDDVDIATIGVPESFEPHSLRKEFYTPDTWPPTRPKVGDAAMLVGLAALHRIADDTSITSSVTIISEFVRSVSNRQFVLADTDQERKAFKFQPELKMLGPTGGMSGAPVFAGGEGERARLRGVLHEGGEGVDAIYFVAHVDFVKSDGSIDSDLDR